MCSMMMMTENKQQFKRVNGCSLYLFPDQGLSLDYLGSHHGFRRLPLFW